ncbi:NAD(P)/FAD-dependent oxidoreductase [Sulfurimonas paralvinellae]|uniref:Aminoacetone oxidase family FAD-binding enzyme n=1 Tax=Sulfurimonas paralvinellae TaxID=317658 RepID=A0A7M1B5Y3_9BACT|nr:aminoacetone oxidase family FAD-binding enzyme [Sulfurimonas paralvinellae]QOP45133.1 aminoacetone oxidase family FAD-binding enzyme [Sulfurimonas paralvinellae]
MNLYDVIILGAGASGLMCAGNLPKKMKVAMIDGNSKPAKKLKISGGGKCNITNVSVALNNYDGDAALLSAVFKKFDKEKLLDLLDRNRVELELRKGRYYFCKKSSDDIINLLSRNAKKAEQILGEKILEVHKRGEHFEVKTDKRVLQSKRVVVATGGESFKNLGASDVGLQIAQNFGLHIKKFTPALVGLTLQKEQFWMKELSGLSCFVEIGVEDRVLREEMLFTHKGISGPAVLSASLYWKKGDIFINFLPDREIKELIKSGGKKLISSVIPLPKRLSKALLSAIGMKDKECSKVQKCELEQLEKLHHYTFAPAGNFGFSKAEVSRGGIATDELDMQSLESKKVKGLYFIGEVVDITGELGGYNFQWSFSSAYVCAKAIK